MALDAALEAPSIPASSHPGGKTRNTRQSTECYRLYLNLRPRSTDLLTSISREFVPLTLARLTSSCSSGSILAHSKAHTIALATSLGRLCKMTKLHISESAIAMVLDKSLMLFPSLQLPTSRRPRGPRRYASASGDSLRILPRYLRSVFSLACPLLHALVTHDMCACMYASLIQQFHPLQELYPKRARSR